MNIHNHNHQACIQRVLDEANSQAATKPFNLTPIRLRVLEMLLENHAAIGAYEVLRRLGEKNMSAQPPVAYRALDFWMYHGFAHKIEHLNAYVACAHPHRAHRPAFLICRHCRLVIEIDPKLPATQVQRQATGQNFLLERTVIEAVGICQDCQRNRTQ